MTTTQTASEAALAAQGATAAALDPTNTGKGNPLPNDPGNTPPVKPEPAKTPEQIAADKKVADDKIVADAAAIKAAADAATAAEREGWQKEYVKIENPDAQAAIDLMNEAGVSPIEANAIFQKAIESGNLADVDWASLEAKIGPAKARLVKNGVEKYHADALVPQQEAMKAAYDIVGGEENWVTVRTWAQTKEKSDPAFAKTIADYRKAIDAGGFAAKAAVSALKGDYEADPKNGGLGQRTIVRGDTQATASGTALTRADYLTEVKKAERDRLPAAAMEALHNRRRAGMKAGI